MSRRVGMPVFAFTCISLFLSGCHKEPMPEFAPVEGVVRINGKPEPRVTVRFTADPEKGNGFAAFGAGTTDNQGKYTLKWQYKDKEGDGAPVGWHRVTLFDTKVGLTQPGQVPKPSAVPYTYGNSATTPLVYEVKAGELQKIDLDVKK